MRQAIERVAPANSRILITGAPGFGKELARAPSTRRRSAPTGRSSRINAATITPENMETELSARRPRTGAARKVGALEEAHGGTLYLDEVADMPRETQDKILRVLVDQNFQRVGGATRVHVDVRIISSASRDLRPPSRRAFPRRPVPSPVGRADPRALACPSGARTFPNSSTFHGPDLADDRHAAPAIGDDAMAVLQSHDWPGNIRQLRNNVERLMILSAAIPRPPSPRKCCRSEIGALVPSTPNGAGGEKLMSLPLREAREVFEREYLVAQISRFGGNISRTAEFIGMERSALHRKLKSLAID